jgi:hypothetical protein
VSVSLSASFEQSQRDDPSLGERLRAWRHNPVCQSGAAYRLFAIVSECAISIAVLTFRMEIHSQTLVVVHSHNSFRDWVEGKNRLTDAVQNFQGF